MWQCTCTLNSVWSARKIHLFNPVSPKCTFSYTYTKNSRAKVPSHADYTIVPDVFSCHFDTNPGAKFLLILCESQPFLENFLKTSENFKKYASFPSLHMSIACAFRKMYKDYLWLYRCLYIRIKLLKIDPFSTKITRAWNVQNKKKPFLKFWS